MAGPGEGLYVSGGQGGIQHDFRFPASAVWTGGALTEVGKARGSGLVT